MKAELGSQEGIDLELRDQMIGVDQGNLAGPFCAMHSDVADLDLHVERNNVEAADLGVSAGNALDFGHQTLAHIHLEGISSGVPERKQQDRQHRAAGTQQILPPTPGPDRGPAHRACAPSGAGVATPGMLTLLSERSVCSHETSSSLTFSSVSNSRILPETSARGTSPAPDCFNCGTNFSR